MNTLTDAGQARLETELEDIGDLLGDARRKSSFAIYASGLLAEGDRKSVEPIAARATGRDALDYPTSEYLRMLWKAVELLAPKLSTVAADFEQLGRFSMDALLRSPVGAPLLATRGDGPVACLTALLPVLDEQLKPGQRTVQSASAQEAVLLFKEDVLPIQVLTRLLASALGTLHGVVPQVTWEKAAAQRVEVTVRWG